MDGGQGRIRKPLDPPAKVEEGFDQRTHLGRPQAGEQTDVGARAEYLPFSTQQQRTEA
jgi:hypothetical protein